MISTGVVGILIIFAIKGEKITISDKVISSKTSSNIVGIIARYTVVELMIKYLNKGVDNEITEDNVYDTCFDADGGFKRLFQRS